MTHHDFRPAWQRLSALMGWDELDDNGPPIITGPRSVPPVRRDAETRSRRYQWATWLRQIRGLRCGQHGTISGKGEL